MKPILIIAFDIEARGKSHSKHGILAVGVVAGLEDGTIVHEKEWRVSPMEGQTYETRCLEQFWNEHRELKQRLEQDTVSPVEFTGAFRAMLNDFEKKYEIYLLSDNPTFDAGFINFYLDAHGEDSMQYASDGTSYRLVHDADEYVRGALRMQAYRQWVNNLEACVALKVGCPAFQGERHAPVNDARAIYQMHVVVTKSSN